MRKPPCAPICLLYTAHAYFIQFHPDTYTGHANAEETDLVGAQQDRGGYLKPECLCRLQVGGNVEARREKDWQVGGREHEVPLSAPARQLSAALLPQQSEFLFPGRADRPRNDLHHHWRSICKAAGITGLRIHDLRHSYASTLVSAGFSLPVIGALLGHSQPQTTARYAHLFDDPLRKATERAGKILAPSAKPSGKVKTFPARAGK